MPTGELRPSGGGDHYRVFSPYLRAWEKTPRRAVTQPPGRVRLPEYVDAGVIHQPWLLPGAAPRPRLPSPIIEIS